MRMLCLMRPRILLHVWSNMIKQCQCRNANCKPLQYIFIERRSVKSLNKLYRWVEFLLRRKKLWTLVGQIQGSTSFCAPLCHFSFGFWMRECLRECFDCDRTVVETAILEATSPDTGRWCMAWGRCVWCELGGNSLNATQNYTNTLVLL